MPVKKAIAVPKRRTKKAVAVPNRRVGTVPPVPKVDEKFMADVVRLSKLGLTDLEISKWFRCSEQSWAELVRKYPRITIEEGYGHSLGVERYAKFSDDKAAEGDVKAMALWLKTRGTWQEVNRQEAPPSRAAGITMMQKVTFKLDDPIEAAKIYERMIKGAK